MESIATLISIPQPIVAKSRRNELLAEIYTLYVSQPEINRKENRKRYHQYMRSHHRDLCIKATFDKDKYNFYKSDFKKAKLPATEKFLSYIKEDRFWYFFSHCDVDGLEKILSEAKDANWRKFNVAQLIMGKVVYKKV